MLLEGGGKFNGQGMPVSREDAEATIDYLHQKYGFKPGLLKLIGSVHKPMFNDVDTLIMRNHLTSEVIDKLKADYPHDPRGGSSFLVPVTDREGNEKPWIHPETGEGGFGSHKIQLDVMSRPNPLLASQMMRHETPTAYSGSELQRVRASVIKNINPNHKWYAGVGIQNREDDKIVDGGNTQEGIAQYVFNDPSKHTDWETVEGIQKHFPDIVAKELKPMVRESFVPRFQSFLTEARANAMTHLAMAGPEHAEEIRNHIAHIAEYASAGSIPPVLATPKYDGSAGITVKNGRVGLSIKPDTTFGSHDEIDNAYPEAERSDLRNGLKAGLEYAQTIPDGHEHKLDVAGPSSLVLHTVNGQSAVRAQGTDNVIVSPAVYGQTRSEPNELRTLASHVTRRARELPDLAAKVKPEVHALVAPVALRAALEGKFNQPLMMRPSQPTAQRQFQDYVASEPRTKGGNLAFPKKRLAAIAALNQDDVKASVDYVKALDSVGKSLNNLTGSFEEPSGGKRREGTVIRIPARDHTGYPGGTFKATTDEFRDRE